MAAEKKRKARVAFRKNRQSRTRANDLTRQFRPDDPTPEAASVDRVRPRGDLSRRRTIIEEVGAASGGQSAAAAPEAANRRAIDTSRCRSGRVVRVHGLV